MAPHGHRTTATPLGVVLAGGLGSRIGGAKASALLAGRPLIEHPIDALRSAGLEPTVVAKSDSPLPPLTCELIAEPDSPRHPLCGIVAALQAADGRAVVVVACDMPFVPPALIAELAKCDAALLVPAPRGEIQPLLARYGPELLAPLQDALQRGEPLRRTVHSLEPELVADAQLAAFGDPGRVFFNVNSDEDLIAAEQLVRDSLPERA